MNSEQHQQQQIIINPSHFITSLSCFNPRLSFLSVHSRHPVVFIVVVYVHFYVFHATFNYVTNLQIERHKQMRNMQAKT